MAQIPQNKWTHSSEKLMNLEKKFFQRLTADSVKGVNNQRNEDGIQYVRKAAVHCRLAKSLNNNWKVHQLFPKLQKIIAQYRKHFQGEQVTSTTE